MLQTKQNSDDAKYSLLLMYCFLLNHLLLIFLMFPKDLILFVYGYG